MKKILKSLFIILLVGSLAAGATRAVWTDEIRIDNITFSSGNADLDIGDSETGGWSDSRGAGWWGITNMAPGEESEARVFWLKNNSSAELDFQTYVRVENLSGNTGDFTDYLELKFEWYDDASTAWTDTGWKSLAWWRDTGSLLNSGRGRKMNVVGPSTHDPRQYRAYLRLRSDTPDSFQGKSLSFDVVFNATQVTP